MLVTSLSVEANSYSAGLGIDLYFTSKAKGTKEIVEIEGMEFQIDMFDSFSEELQLEFLQSTLSSGEQNQSMESMAELMKYWKSGDAEQLGKLVKGNDDGGNESLQEFNNKMWEERDNNMTKKVKEYLNDSENTYCSSWSRTYVW